MTPPAPQDAGLFESPPRGVPRSRRDLVDVAVGECSPSLTQPIAHARPRRVSTSVISFEAFSSKNLSAREQRRDQLAPLQHEFENTRHAALVISRPSRLFPQ